MNLRPLRDRLTVRRIHPPGVSDAGLHLLPHVDRELVKEAVQGEVIGVGPGVPGDRHGMWGLSVGDRIAFSPVLAAQIEPDVLVIKRDSVMGVYQ